MQTLEIEERLAIFTSVKHNIESQERTMRTHCYPGFESLPFAVFEGGRAVSIAR